MTLGISVFLTERRLLIFNLGLSGSTSVSGKEKAEQMNIWLKLLRRAVEMIWTLFCSFFTDTRIFQVHSRWRESASFFMQYRLLPIWESRV
jgi:hypothetical protein